MFKVYVGNLPYGISVEDLSDYFSDCLVGDDQEILSCTIISDRETGRSKGFGFVEFSHEDAMLKAIEKGNNGVELDGRELRISEAKPQERSNRS